MRVECESCRALVVASFAYGGGVVRATCPICQHTTCAQLGSASRATRPSLSPVALGDSDGLDATLCPKCGALRRDGAPACPACGLLIARMPAYIAARDALVPDAVRDAWTRVAEAWGDAAAHDELLRQVAAHNGYAWAAGRYRTRGKDPVAVHQLERLRRAAEATLLAGATAREPGEAKPYRLSSTVLTLMVVAIVGSVLYAIVISDRGSARAGAAPSAPAVVHPLVPGHPVSPSTIK